MEKYTPAGIQQRWSYSDLRAFKNCPRQWFLNRTAPEGPTQRTSFGRLWHSALECYNWYRWFDHPRDEALAYTLWWLDRQDTSTLWTTNAQNEETLQRALTSYVDTIDWLPPLTLAMPEVYPALEAEFQVSFDRNRDWKFIVDKLELDPHGNIWAVDYKSTTATLGDDYYKQFSPSSQVASYIWGLRQMGIPVHGFIIDATQFLVSGCRHQRLEITLTQSQIREWYEDTKIWLDLADTFIQNNHMPMNDNACKFCRFQEICSLPPEVRND